MRGLGKWIWDQSKLLPYAAEGQLISKAITGTQAKLSQVFPAELAARNVGHSLFYNSTYTANNTNCESFVAAVVPAVSGAVSE